MNLSGQNISFKTLTDLFIGRRHSEKGIVFIEDRQDIKMTYGEVYEKALILLGGLQALSLKPGCVMIFQFSNNLDFIISFWACVLGGYIPIPLRMGNTKRDLAKVSSVYGTLEEPHILTCQRDAKRLQKEMEGYKQPLPDLAAGMILMESACNSGVKGQVHDAKEQDIALIQFSSGSTGDPKGVVLTHKNLITDISDMTAALKVEQNNQGFLNWQTLAHVMGLVVLHLNAVYGDCNSYMMVPELFIRNPAFWLKKITEYRPNFIGTPNFSIQYILRALNSRKLNDIDLSSVKALLNGSEPISVAVCDEFTEKMRTYGLADTAIYPIYGLTESSSIVSFHEIGKRYRPVYIDRRLINIGQRVRPISPDDDCAVAFMEAGYPMTHCSVRITDDQGNRIVEGIIGHIEISGDNVTSGYYQRPDMKNETFTADGWLKTGDLGFFNNGALVITGRKKDVIFVNGNSYFPHDIENLCSGLEKEDSNIVVCGAFNQKLQKEEILCFVEYAGGLQSFIPMADRLASHIVDNAGVGVAQIIPVDEIQRTVSGKVQRYQLKEAYVNGKFDSVIAEMNQLRKKISR